MESTYSCRKRSFWHASGFARLDRFGQRQALTVLRSVRDGAVGPGREGGYNALAPHPGNISPKPFLSHASGSSLLAGCPKLARCCDRSGLPSAVHFSPPPVPANAKTIVPPRGHLAVSGCSPNGWGGSAVVDVVAARQSCAVSRPIALHIRAACVQRREFWREPTSAR